MQKRRDTDDYKRRGEWVELKFMTEAAERNVPSSKPYGESENFDVVIGRPGKFVGVQVKSTSARQRNGYSCDLTTRRIHRTYAVGAFDFLAAYVIPENAWYIIPANVIHGKGSILLYPNSPNSANTKYEQYREAWNLLQEAVGVKEEPSLPAEESAPPNRMEARMMGAFNFVRKHWER